MLTVLAFSTRVDYAQANFLGKCHHAEGSAIYRPDGVVIRYEFRNARLVLVSMATGDIVQTLEDSLVTSDLQNLAWSPDCHTLFGTANGDAILWDVLNGGRIATFSHVTPKNPPYWNPDRDALILEAYGGSYLWNFRQAVPLLLTFNGRACKTGYRYFNWQVEWDNSSNQVMVAPNYAGGGTVIAYDQSNARQLALFDNGCNGDPVKFSLTPDDQKVIVFTAEDEAFAGYYKAVSVWDRGTMQHVTVDANTQSAVLPSQIALSADGRYLVLARVGTMRVWDLSNLAGDIQQRDPVYRHSIEPNTSSVRFVIDTVVETSDFNGRKLQWDVVSGAQVNG
jgi:WD40 repeat protein